MTNTDTADGDGLSISERIERLKTIAETLEEGEIGLERAKELREEADEHLEALREELDLGGGDIIEVEAEEPRTNGDG